MNASLSTAAPWWRPDTGHRLIVRGGRPLVGAYPISGAKNAVLPPMVSALLTPHLVTLRNVPANLDVAVLAALLQRLGCGMHWSASDSGLAVTIAADRVQPQRIDAELVSRMRYGPSAARGAWSPDGTSLLLEVQTLGNDDVTRLTFAFADKAVEVTYELAIGHKVVLKGRTDD